MLTGDNAKGLNFINSKDQTGTLNIKFNNHDVTLEILKVNSKISLKNKDKHHLKFHITINVKAGIAEQYGSLHIHLRKCLQHLKGELRFSEKCNLQKDGILLF